MEFLLRCAQKIVKTKVPKWGRIGEGVSWNQIFDCEELNLVSTRIKHTVRLHGDVVCIQLWMDNNLLSFDLFDPNDGSRWLTHIHTCMHAKNLITSSKANSLNSKRPGC